MTIVTIVTIAYTIEAGAMKASTWTVAAAKAKLSEVIDLARSHGPQTITRKGRAVAVVSPPRGWERRTRRSGNLAKFFAASPLLKSGLAITPRADRPRKLEL